MRKTLTIICVFILSSLAKAQPAAFYLSNTLRFVNAANDTIPFPFIGGFVSPQFSEIDLNNDGIKDLFVFDRSGNKKMTFINEGKAGQVSYIYAPRYEYYFPTLYRWVLLRDYNCDGKEDLFAGSEQSGFAVYKNVSTADSIMFEHITEDLIFNTGDKMYNLTMDLPVLDDIDGDGDLDILSFGVLGGYVEYYRNDRVEKGLPCDSLSFSYVDFCWGSFVEAGFTNDIFLGDNCFGLKFYKSALHAGSTMLTFDADGDGDKDMIIGDVDYPDFKFLINGKVETSWPYDTIISYTNNFPLNTKGVYIDKFPAAFYLDINNDGKKDLIASSNEANSASNLHQVWWYSNSGQNNQPNFTFRDSSFLQDLTIDFGSVTQPVFFDFDGDGDLDLIVSNRGNWRETFNNRDRLALYENIGRDGKAVFKLKNEDYLNLSSQNLAGVSPTFADLNGDGLLDLVLGLLNGRLRYYQNTGTISAPNFVLQTDTLGSIDVGVLATPHFYDMDGDSVLDLISGNSDGFVRYHRNRGTRNQPYFLSIPDVDTLGRIRTSSFFYNYNDFDQNGNPTDSTKTFDYEGMSAPWIADLDNDGNPEIISGSRNGQIYIFPLDRNNLFDSFPSITDYFIQPHTLTGSTVDLGGRTIAATADLDGDGRLDMLVGNSRGGLHFLSSIYTPEEPLTTVEAKRPEAKFHVFPNPSTGKVIVQSDGAFPGIAQIEVMDLMGRKHHGAAWNTNQSTLNELDLSRLSNGTYFIQITGTNFRSQGIKVVLLR